MLFCLVFLKNQCYFVSDRESTPIFVATPEEVVFTDYKVGEVYEKTLELKNVSAVLRPVRVIPPKTVFFAIGLGKYVISIFPGSQLNK